MSGTLAVPVTARYKPVIYLVLICPEIDNINTVNNNLILFKTRLNYIQ